MMTNNWFVITGGPSTGKSKLIKEFENLGYKTVPEVARTVIDEAISKGATAEEYRRDEKKFQYEVANLKAEIEKNLDSNEIVFFDRGMQDTMAYLKYYDFEIDKTIKSYLEKSKYQKVFILEPLERFKEDYARVESPEFSSKIYTFLIDAYKEYGMVPISVPDIGLNNRLQFIIDKIEIGRK
jgi:predicted ATPase